MNILIIKMIKNIMKKSQRNKCTLGDYAQEYDTLYHNRVLASFEKYRYLKVFTKNNHS